MKWIDNGGFNWEKWNNLGFDRKKLDLIRQKMGLTRKKRDLIQEKWLELSKETRGVKQEQLECTTGRKHRRLTANNSSVCNFYVPLTLKIMERHAV